MVISRYFSEVIFPIAISSFQDFFEIFLDFQRMEKLEFGGLKGKLYSEHAAQMYMEFSNHCQALQHSDSSPLDLNSQVKLFLLPYAMLHKIATNSYCIDHVQYGDIVSGQLPI